jgi:hypothetical protein
MKAANPDMYVEYLPKDKVRIAGREVFFRAFWTLLQCIEGFKHYRLVLSIDGTFLTGK